MKVLVNEIEVEEATGEVTINPGATEAGDDWIRAARLLKEGKTEELEEMGQRRTHYDIPE